MRAIPIRILAATLGAVTAIALAGCSSGSPNSTTGSGTPGAASDQPVTYALMPDQGPSWVAPISPPDKMVTANGALHALMWVPLFQYDGASGKLEWDQKASAASSYTFSADNTSIDITLGNLTWSDGKPVTSRDVQFSYNLVKNNTDLWGSYSAGLYPDSVKSFTITDDKHFTITFDKAYNQQFLLANQLSMIVPMPQHAWDIDKAGNPVGDYDQTADGAKAVWQYIQTQAADVSTYATNPMWQVINGPYALKSWAQDGSVTIVANTKYTGDDKPSITTVNFKPYTSNDAEMNDVRAGALDYGFITPDQLSAQGQYTSLGYNVVPWAGWSITYMPYNFANPTMGPVFKQLYVRQGLQSAIDQPTLSSKVWMGAAMPGYGPIPQNPPSDYLSSVQANNPYPYDLTKAEKYFTDNGWTKGSDGILACTNPGTGAGQCGDGIAAGTQMKITVTTQNGSQQTDNMMAAIKSALSQIGVSMTIQSVTLDNVLTTAQTCKQGTDCSWQLVFFGTAGSWYFSAYPSGQSLFSQTAKWNCGQYYDTKAFDLINQMLTSSDTDIAQQYSAYLAQQLPVMWMPNPVYQISVVKTNLNIATQDPGGAFMPQRWSWTA
ncbi:MAG: peptide ABC transporter substrate-binding protein [Propionibacteriaceae bacterium]|nr:peptide ABC transporter substrate-binding protein [Propionibacteriaceae bacterium]